MVAANFMICSTASFARSTPAARAKAATSSMIVRNNRQVAGVSRMTPSVSRVTAVVPPTAQITRYFSHSAPRIVLDSSTGISACANASPSRSPRSLPPPAGGRALRPKTPADAAGPHHHDVHDTYDTLRGSMASLERRVAIDAARAAGQLLKNELPGSRRIAYKGSPTNLVTEMDARVEELIVGRLAMAFPDDAVLAEERGASKGRSGRRWIIDPLDGTTEHAHGLPAFCGSIGAASA